MTKGKSKGLALSQKLALLQYIIYIVYLGAGGVGMGGEAGVGGGGAYRDLTSNAKKSSASGNTRAKRKTIKPYVVIYYF